jgi:uncharacterized caspase-like protein
VPPLADHYAIAIGIDTYPVLRRLTSAVRDATAFLEWVTDDDGGNVDPENVRLIRSPEQIPADRFDATPIQDQIDRALRDFGAEAGRRIGKRLYFYFAGHGLGPNFDEVGMLMAVASMNSLTKNIGLRAYRDYFHETGLFDEVVYFVDCCRDHTRGVTTSPPGFSPVAAVTGRAEKVVDFVALAAGYGDQAFAPVTDLDGERRGILTTALLEALKGHPKAVDAQARITAASLQIYLKERVKAIGVDEKLKQEPEMPQDLNPNLVFRQVDVATLPKLTAHIVAVTASAGDLILRDARDLTKVVAQQPVAAATEASPWVIKLLPHTRYEIENPDSDRTMVLDPAKAKEDPFVFKF